MDDEHVVRHLCGRHVDMPDFAIRDKKGFTQLRDAIGPEVKVAGRTALGILVDANDDLDARWEAVGRPPTAAGGCGAANPSCGGRDRRRKQAARRSLVDARQRLGRRT